MFLSISKKLGDLTFGITLVTSSEFLDSAMFIPNVVPKYLKFHNLPTFQTMYQLVMIFL